MKICICSKSNKDISTTKADVAIVYSIITIALITVAFFNIMLATGFSLMLLGYIAIATILRLLVSWHKPLCSLRWSVISIARIAQYF